VDSRHEGCYTGGKVMWSEGRGSLACLCNEELHLVDPTGAKAAQRVKEEDDPVLTFAVDPAGKNACTSHKSGLMRHYQIDGDAPTLVRSFKAHEALVSDVCFDATGSFVATGSIDRIAKVFDFAGYFCTHSFKNHIGLVSLVRFHPSKLQLVTVADNEARLYDLKTSALVGTMKDHMTSISSLTFGQVKTGVHQLITGGRDQVISVWNLEDKKCSLNKTIPVFESLEGVATVPLRELKQAAADSTSSFATWLHKKDKQQLPPYVILTVGEKSQLRVWNPNDGKCVATMPSPHAAKGLLRSVLSVDEAGGKRIMTIGEDLNLVLWSLPDFKVINYVMGHNEEIVHVQLLPQLSWKKHAADDAHGQAKASSRGGHDLVVSASRFVCISNDEHPRVVDCEGFNASLLRGHTEVVICCDVSPDGRWIATGGKDSSIRIWCAERSSCICICAGHTGAVSALSFAKKRPKGPKDAAAGESRIVQLASSGQDKTLKLWDLPTPKQLAEVAENGSDPIKIEKAAIAVIAHSKEVNDVLVAPNNKCVASAGSDKVVRIWSFPEYKLLGECKGHRRGVWCVAFSPTDQVLASASGDGAIRLWNLKDYRAIRAFEGHTGPVLRVCFLSNGMQLMSSGNDGLLKLWQIRTADCALTLDEHSSKVWCIDVVGDRMVSGGTDSKLCVWRDSTSEQAKERQDARAELALKDGRIAKLARQGKVEEALNLCLDLDRPGQMQQILREHTMAKVSKHLARSTAKEQAAKDGVTLDKDPVADEEGTQRETNLRRWISKLKSAQLEKFVGLLEQWNTNRRMSSMAQMFMGLLLEVVPPDQLQKIEGMNATCSTFLSYSSRHLARVDALLQKTFIFDLVLQGSAQGLALFDEDDSFGNATAMVEARKAAEGALQKTMEVLHEKGASEDEDSDLVASSDEEEEGEAEAAAGGEAAMSAEEDGDREARSVAQAEEEAPAEDAPAKKRRKTKRASA